jgi:hypothetical protein
METPVLRHFRREAKERDVLYKHTKLSSFVFSVHGLNWYIETPVSGYGFLYPATDAL